MKVPDPRYVKKQDLGAGAPEWATKLLSSMNSAFEKVVSPLQSNLSAKDNMNAELREIDVRHEVESKFRLNTLRGRARDLWVTRVLSPAGSYSPSIVWSEDPNDRQLLALTCSFPGGAGAYRIRVRVEGD